jgi:hypothetical protein
MAVEAVCGFGKRFPNAMLRLCAYHHITQPFQKLSGKVSDQSALKVYSKMAYSLTTVHTQKEFDVTFGKLAGGIQTLCGGQDTVLGQDGESLLASLRVHESRYGGHIFHTRVTLGHTAGSRSK